MYLLENKLLIENWNNTSHTLQSCDWMRTTCPVFKKKSNHTFLKTATTKIAEVWSPLRILSKISTRVFAQLVWKEKEKLR